MFYQLHIGKKMMKDKFQYYINGYKWQNYLKHKVWRTASVVKKNSQENLFFG